MLRELGNLTRGFGIDRWFASQSPAFVARMTAALWEGIRGSNLPLPVRGRFALDNFAEALRVTIARRPGKIVFPPGLNA